MNKLILLAICLVFIAAGCNKKQAVESEPVVAGVDLEASDTSAPLVSEEAETSKPESNENQKTIQDLQKQIDELKKQQKQSVAPKPAPVYQTPQTETLPQQPAVDLCSNVEGNQTSLPIGMRRSEDNNCFIKTVDTIKSDDITVSEISQYKSGVVVLLCSEGQGSGSLWYLGNKYYVLTNGHVIDGTNSDCYVVYRDELNVTKGVYIADASNAVAWNSTADEALLPIIGVDNETFPNSIPISNLNYSIGEIEACRSMLPEGTKVVLIGFPASGATSRIVTDGIISGHRARPTGLPQKNYYVSNKIDNGNSGGIALAKWEGEVCILGIPTASQIGQISNEAIVQNIENILYH